MRDKLLQYNTIADAIQLIRQSQRIVILTGAGISKLLRASLRSARFSCLIKLPTRRFVWHT